MRVNICNKQLFSDVLLKMFPGIDLPEINGLTIDSRKVERGDIFLPLKGNNIDGHHFISQAEAAGASLVFVENPIATTLITQQVQSTKTLLYDLAREYRNQLSYPFIGITGSNGKTTTKDLLCHVLSSQMNVNMRAINIISNNGVFEGEITLFVHNVTVLNTLTGKLKNVDGVTQIKRIYKNI